VDEVTPSIKLCDGFLSLDAGVRSCVIVLKQHFPQVLVMPNTLETLPHFFSVLVYVSELTVTPLCITSRRITPSQFQNIVTITFPADGEKSRSCVFPTLCPVTYSGTTDCSNSTNIAEPFMDVPHHFFHCNKKH
jgi:hypothetical protein